MRISDERQSLVLFGNKDYRKFHEHFGTNQGWGCHLLAWELGNTGQPRSLAPKQLNFHALYFTARTASVERIIRMSGRIPAHKRWNVQRRERIVAGTRLLAFPTTPCMHMVLCLKSDESQKFGKSQFLFVQVHEQNERLGYYRHQSCFKNPRNWLKMRQRQYEQIQCYYSLFPITAVALIRQSQSCSFAFVRQIHDCEKNLFLRIFWDFFHFSSIELSKLIWNK